MNLEIGTKNYQKKKSLVSFILTLEYFSSIFREVYPPIMEKLALLSKFGCWESDIENMETISFNLPLYKTLSNDLYSQNYYPPTKTNNHLFIVG